MSGEHRRAIGLFALDREQFSLRNGVVGLVAIAAALVVLAAVGYAGVAAVLGAVITAVSAGTDRLRARVARGIAVATVGSLFTLLGVWSGENGWTAGLVVTLVTFAATFGVVFGKAAATASFLVNLWLLLALTFTVTDHSWGGLAASFLAGGAFAVALQPLAVLRSKRSGHPAVDDAGAATRPPADERRTVAPLRAELRLDSPLFRFAVVRALAAGGATTLGWYLFDQHPYWAVIVAFVIVKSDPVESLAIGVHRFVGTVAGAAAGLIVVQNIDSQPVLTILLVVASMLMVAFMRVNYAVFTFFLTSVLVLSTRLVQGDVDRAAGERVQATLLGVGIAFAVMVLVLTVAGRRAGAAQGDATSD